MIYKIVNKIKNYTTIKNESIILKDTSFKSRYEFMRSFPTKSTKDALVSNLMLMFLIDEVSIPLELITHKELRTLVDKSYPKIQKTIALKQHYF